MGQNNPNVTDAQLAVLQLLWERGPSTIRQITDVLYPSGREAEYATVQKLLERLEDNEHVLRDRSRHAHVFTASTRLETLVGHRMREMAEKLCGGDMAPLLTHLVQAETLTPQERQQLRDLIDQLDQEPKSGRKRKK